MTALILKRPAWAHPLFTSVCILNPIDPGFDYYKEFPPGTRPLDSSHVYKPTTDFLTDSLQSLHSPGNVGWYLCLVRNYRLLEFRPIGCLASGMPYTEIVRMELAEALVPLIQPELAGVLPWDLSKAVLYALPEHRFEFLAKLQDALLTLRSGR